MPCAHHAIVESYILFSLLSPPDFFFFLHCRLVFHLNFSWGLLFFYRRSHCLSREIFPSQFERFHQGGAVVVCPWGLSPSHTAHQLGRMVLTFVSLWVEYKHSSEAKRTTRDSIFSTVIIEKKKTDVLHLEKSERKIRYCTISVFPHFLFYIQSETIFIKGDGGWKILWGGANKWSSAVVHFLMKFFSQKLKWIWIGNYVLDVWKEEFCLVLYFGHVTSVC